MAVFRRRSFRLAVAVKSGLLLLIALASILCGCATTNPDQPESDIPWNAPQSWEGAPGIPGFEAR